MRRPGSFDSLFANDDELVPTTSSAAGPQTRPAQPHILTVLVLVMAFVAAVWVLGKPYSAEEHALLELPAQQRSQVFAGVLTEVKTLCVDGTRGGLEAHCQHQATFLSKFPECDNACLSLVRPLLAHPTR